MNEVSADKLMDYTRHVAAEVRLSGSPEEARAFDYIKTVLEQCGLTTQLYHSDAYISLPRSAKLTVGSCEYKCITHSMAASTGPAGVSGELAYVGKGSRQDYAEVAAAGKIVVADGLAMGAAVKLAEEAGAAGAIFVTAEYTHEMITSYVWGSPTPETCGLLPRIPVVSVTLPDGERIKAQLADTPQVMAKLITEVESGWKKIPALVADISGTDEADKYVLLSGHVDGWHFGAMDNGSANAGMIEVARVLSRHRDLLKRSVKIAFWSGHSHGRYAGSAWYCDAHFEDLYDNCFLHVNVDSLGAKGAVILTEANCMAETRDLGAAAIRSIAGQDFAGTRFGRAGDQSFWGTGTPSLFMGLSEQALTKGVAAETFAALFGNGKTGGFGWWWHTTEDTIDKIDPANLTRDAQVYLLVLYRACADAIVPINHLAAVTEINDAIDGYDKVAAGRVDLGLACQRVRRLQHLVADVYKRAGSVAADADRRTVNEYIMELSRLLVPLNYVKGSIYDHDLALRQSAVPLLDEIRELSGCAPGSDEENMLKVLLRRRINKINHLLAQAVRLTEAVLAKLA